MNNTLGNTRTVVLPKNSREELHVSLDAFKGHTLINLRVWYRSEDGDMRPTKKGVALRAGSLPAVIAALTELNSHIEAKDAQCF